MENTRLLLPDDENVSGTLSSVAPGRFGGSTLRRARPVRGLERSRHIKGGLGVNNGDSRNSRAERVVIIPAGVLFQEVVLMKLISLEVKPRLTCCFLTTCC